MEARERERRQHGTLRVEDDRLVRGAGRFGDDLRLADEVAGVFVRSTHAHARLTRVAIAQARDMPGVIAILTAADIAAAGVGSISRPKAPTGRDGREMIVPHRPALAGERVVHVGEPIALVVAETVAAARDAADAVEVDYDPLPAVTDVRAALAADAPQIWPEAPGNVALDWPGPPAARDAGPEVERIIAAADRVVRVEAVNQRLAGAPMQPRVATAVFDAATGRFTLHAASQSAHVLKGELCQVMGVAPDRLRVLSGDVGGAFGLLTRGYPEYAAVLVAAKAVGRPVRWTATRSEAFLSDNQGRDNIAEATLALDRDGRFLALRVSAVTNLGAYVASAGPITGTTSFGNCFPEMYDIKHVAVATTLVFTNTLPTGPYRGAGRPEANYLMERAIDAAARATGIDPIELRLRNLIGAAAMPYRSAVGNVYDSGDFAGVLARAAERAGVAGFARRREQAKRRGRLAGLGVGCFLEHAGGGPYEGAVLAVEGDTVVVRLGMQPSGQGHATVFANLAAERLGLAPDRVVVEQGDSDLPFRGGPAVGSRSSNAAGSAIVDGIERLVSTARALAADLLRADLGDVAYRDGYLEVVGTNHRLSLFELAERLERSGSTETLTTVAEVQPVTTFPNGCHIAAVEIDPDTGAVTVVGYVAVDDCGVVLDPTLAEAQVVGGIAQGLGQALMEAMVYDDAGQVVSGSFMDYAMPRATDIPPIGSAFHAVACLTNPLGVKGVGEAGATAAIAAIMNAIADAVPDGQGAKIAMPATAEKVWRACAAARDRR